MALAIALDFLGPAAGTAAGTSLARHEVGGARPRRDPERSLHPNLAAPDDGNPWPFGGCRVLSPVPPVKQFSVTSCPFPAT